MKDKRIKMKDKSIELFLNTPWREDCPESEWYIEVAVVYPEGSYPQLLFNSVAFANFCKSLQKPNSEVTRLVWRYLKHN